MIHKMTEVVKRAKRNNGKIWIYPMGKIGQACFSVIKDSLGFDKLERVDNYLCIGNSAFFFIEEAADHFRDEDIMLLSSEIPEVYGSVKRADIRSRINARNIISIYGEYPFTSYSNMRLTSLVYASDDIYRNDIQGNIAEAGVYRGDFAQYMNILFPDRKMYLFDSFEGFNKTDASEQKDSKQQYSEWINGLKDTTVELVMEKMKWKENVVLKKGFVPDTFEGVEDTFCFVNLDMDLYLPTKEALNFFWPRMERGGYIFVHDFLAWDGIETAVLEFCKEQKAGYVRLADKASVALVKPF